MKKITFVTTNKGKIASAKQYLGDLDIEVEPYNYELIEPRTDDIQEIAKQKVLQAYELVKHPCIAMDSGFYIDALNGEEAIKLYELFNQELSKYIVTKAGVFGADMSVAISNDGPVTILLEC